jgi:hypothetical protein
LAQEGSHDAGLARGLFCEEGTRRPKGKYLCLESQKKEIIVSEQPNKTSRRGEGGIDALM